MLFMFFKGDIVSFYTSRDLIVGHETPWTHRVLRPTIITSPLLALDGSANSRPQTRPGPPVSRHASAFTAFW